MKENLKKNEGKWKKKRIESGTNEKYSSKNWRKGITIQECKKNFHEKYHWENV